MRLNYTVANTVSQYYEVDLTKEFLEEFNTYIRDTLVDPSQAIHVGEEFIKDLIEEPANLEESDFRVTVKDYFGSNYTMWFTELVQQNLEQFVLDYHSYYDEDWDTDDAWFTID